MLEDTSAPDYIKRAATISTLKKVLKKHAGNRAVFIENKHAGKLSRSFQRNAILQLIFEILNEKRCKPFDKGIVRKIQLEQEEELRKMKEQEDRRKDIERKRMQKLEQDQESLKVVIILFLNAAYSKSIVDIPSTEMPLSLLLKEFLLFFASISVLN